MNKNYALVWNQSQGCWNVASEGTRRHGKPGSAKRAIAAAAVVLGLGALATAHALPTGQSIVSGSGDVQVYNGGRNMTVNQQSDKLIVNWNEFNIGAAERVAFNQPANTSVVLNRVVTAATSNIDGALDANGRVFLVNPNGMLFGRTAQVNVGGLVASAQGISDADFLNGNYRFAGSTGAQVWNYGTINAAPGGSVALLGTNVNNTGTIQALLGRVALGAGNDFTVSFDGSGLLNLQVNGAALSAVAQNGGVLRANGGQVLMTAQAAGSLQQAVVNNTGVVEAKTLAGYAGRITLDGGDAGTVRVAGSLNASALSGPGNGGVVETKGADVQVLVGTQVSTQASYGQTGTWRIGTAEASVRQTGSAGGSTVTADTLARSLGTTNVELVSNTGNLSVYAPVAWSSGNKLALTAAGDVNINGVALTASGAGSGMEINYGAGNALKLNNGAVVTLSGTGASFKSNGYFYDVIQNFSQLQNVNNNLGGYYVVGTDFRGAYMTPIGSSQVFSGIFEGLGHTLSDIRVSGTGPYVGLFGISSGRISNLNLASLTAVGPSGWPAGGIALVGGLAGANFGQINNVNVTGVKVDGNVYGSSGATTGGLVGMNFGTIDTARVAGTVSGNDYSQAVGGLVGENFGRVINSQTNVSLMNRMSHNLSGSVGGLVGINNGDGTGGSAAGFIADSSSLGTITNYAGGANYGGLVGYNRGGTVASSFFATGSVNATGGYLGGLVGRNEGGSITGSYASGRVTGSGAATVGGLVGWNQAGNLTDVRASGVVENRSGVSVGGLVGTHDGGTILNAEAAGEVYGGSGARVGGLVGSSNGGAIVGALATGNVWSGSNSHVGGLVGYNAGDLQGVEARGNVSSGSNSYVGGLVGTNNTSLDPTAMAISGVASGSVTGQNYSMVGGLVGQNNGRILGASASGSVKGGSYASLGGLVGVNNGVVEYSQASGKVNATAYYGQNGGGLVGVNYGRMSYNAVSGDAALVPLAGRNFGTIE